MSRQPDNKIRVLYVTHYTALYGANRSMLQLMLELREKGVEPTVMLPYDIDESGRSLVDELNEHSISYIKANVTIVKSVNWKKVVVKYIYSLLQLKDAYKALGGSKFDLIHSNSSTFVTGAYLSKKLRLPHVWHLREFGDLDYDLKTPFGKWYQRVIYGGQNTFVAISKKIEAHYRPYVGRQNIRMIYNGVKPFRTIKGKQHSDAITRLCIVGLLQESKRQIDVLYAANELVNSRKVKDFKIFIIGDGDSVYEEKLSEYIKNNKLTDYVIMTGRKDNIPEILQKMDVGIIASSAEAFGRVTVEYMMAGLAVVASDGGACGEIIDNDITGLLYTSGDYVALADKMQTLIQDREKRYVLAKHGQSKAEQSFSSVSNGNSIYDLYRELLEKSAGTPLEEEETR